MPIEEFDFKIFIVITIGSIFLVLAGYLGYIRRDVLEGG